MKWHHDFMALLRLPANFLSCMQTEFSNILRVAEDPIVTEQC